MTRIAVVVNPASGNGRGSELVEAVERRGHLAFVTERPGDTARRVKEAADAGAEVIAAAGGDGTCHAVIGALMTLEGPPAFGIVPLGTGNDLARNLGLPLDPEVAIEALERPGRSIDLMRLRIDGVEELCANVLNGGVSGRVSDALTEEIKERWGRLSYLRAVTEVVGELTPWRVRVDWGDGDGGEYEGYNLAIANGPAAGGGVPIAPGADPADGLVDVVLVRAAPLGRLASLVPAVLAGEEPESELFQSWQVPRGRIVAEPALPYSLDGEPGEGRDFRFEVLPASLEVRGVEGG